MPKIITPDELKAWQSKLGLNRQDAAKLLNDTPLVTYKKWIYGQNRIPNHLELALCEATRRHEANETKNI